MDWLGWTQPESIQSKTGQYPRPSGNYKHFWNSVTFTIVLSRTSQECLVLYQLCSNMKWDWKREHLQAFELIKNKMISAPVLALPRDKGQWLVEIDASNFTFGGILSQQQLIGKFHLVTYLSKEMSPLECNWEIYNKEPEAIKLAFDTW